MICKCNLHITQSSCINRSFHLRNFCIDLRFHRSNLGFRIIICNEQFCNITLAVTVISESTRYIKQLWIHVQNTVYNIFHIGCCQSIACHIYGILQVLHGSHNRCIMRMVITTVRNRIACFQQTTLRQQSASILMNNLRCLLQRLVQFRGNSSHSIYQQHHGHKQIRK